MPSAPLTTREAALEFLYGRIDYERTAQLNYGPAGLKLGRMNELLARCGDPHRGLPAVHVAGTKGKGSTACMIAAATTAAGYRTGLFSSPHLDRIEERTAIDGRPQETSDLVALAELVRPHVEAMDAGGAESAPTYFEITTAMAFLQFRRSRADLAVLEVGLGGRLDSTNVCEPVACVITSISYDHTQQLGNTLAAIAGEKAGIIKPGIPVISGVVPAEPRDVIRAVAAREQSLLFELAREFDFRYEPPRALNRAARPARIDFHDRRRDCRLAQVELASLGRHQGANATLALATLGALAEQGWQISETAARQGLAAVTCPARIEIVSRQPTVVLDTAHNVASVEALLETLNESFDCARRVLVFATTLDKDYAGMLARLLPAFDEVVLTRYQLNPRGVPVEALVEVSARLGFSPQACADPGAAWETARSLTRSDDLLCIAGSFYLAAEMRRQMAAPAARHIA